MKKFTDFINLKEISANKLGRDVLAGASSVGLDSKTEAALQSVLEAFELMLNARPTMVINWLKRTSSTIPEVSAQIQEILKQHDFESLPELKGAVRKAGRRLKTVMKKGLGDEGPNDDVLSPSAADSFKGEAYLIETTAVCARCGKEGRASLFDVNAGKAKCRDCGGYMNKKEKAPKKKKENLSGN
jgi:hypothetical protein